MLNDVNVKNSRDSLRCKYQLKQITKVEEKCCNQLRVYSENNEPKISKPQLQHFMQNSILEQAKVAE